MIRPLYRMRRAKRRRGRTYAHARAGIRLTTRPVAQRRSLPPEKIACLGLLAAALVLVVVFATSPKFFVYNDEVQLRGLTALTQEEVLQGAAIPDGLSVFFLRTAAVEAQLRSLPLVADVHASLRFPNRLTINIQERQPKAVWVTAGAPWWIDETGKVLCAARPSSDLPTILCDAQQTIQPGDQMDEATVNAAMQYHRLMPEATVFRYAPGLGLSTTTPGGWTVHLGDGSDSERKVQILSILTDYFAQNGIQPKYVDLRVPDVPSYKP